MGKERKVFTKERLSVKPLKSGKTAQQERMRGCNKEAGEKQLNGNERKKFTSTCLSNKSHSPVRPGWAAPRSPRRC
jgi:hypothetical protein